MNATGVTAGPAESNGSLLPGIWRDSLHVTCGLTACTPGSAPGPTLGNEYGKTLPLFTQHLHDIYIKLLLALPAEQGLGNGTVSVRLSVLFVRCSRVRRVCCCGPGG